MEFFVKNIDWEIASIFLNVPIRQEYLNKNKYEVVYLNVSLAALLICTRFQDSEW